MSYLNFFSLLLKILKNGAEKPKSGFSNIRRTNKNLAIFSCLGDFLSKNWFIRLFTLRLHAVRGLIFKIVAFFQLTWSNPISHFRFGSKRNFNGSAWQYMWQKITKNGRANHSGPWILISIPKMAIETSLNTFQSKRKIIQNQILASLVHRTA